MNKILFIHLLLLQSILFSQNSSEHTLIGGPGLLGIGRLFGPSFDHDLLKKLGKKVVKYRNCNPNKKSIGKSIILEYDKFLHYNTVKNRNEVIKSYVSSLLPDIFYQLPENLKADDYSEIETVICFDNYFTTVGNYGYSIDAYEVVSKVYIVDKKSNCLIAKKTFIGAPPPKSAGRRSGIWSRTGALPEDEMLEFILQNS